MIRRIGLALIVLACAGAAAQAAEVQDCERRVAQEYSLPRSFGGERLLSAILKKEGKRPPMEILSAGYRVKTAKGDWSVIFDHPDATGLFSVKYVSDEGRKTPKRCPAQVKAFSPAFHCLKGSAEMESESSAYFLSGGETTSVYRAKGRAIVKLTVDTRFSCEFSVTGVSCQCASR